MSFLFLLVAGGALAQMTDGSITGTVRDASGAIVPGAKVESVNRNTGVLTTVQTNREGLFFFAALNPGLYRLSVDRSGFRKSTLDRIQLDVGAKLTLD
ncbi:MAG: carboxypeptidase-like regulatory domain-containing protein, partial [Acidobacteriota bacterium]